MVNHLRSICLLLMSLSIWQANANGITATASIDRQTITIDDSLTLTVRINDVGTYKTPDLSALEKDFQIAGTSQSSRRSLINGRSNSTTEWVISLYPKRDGLLMIPPIRINDAKTDPIAVQVNKAFALPAGQLDIAFIENSLSHTEAYVQQQLLLNVSIYHSIQLDDMNISDLELTGATVKKVGQNSFYRTVKGIRHRVHEINYAIFPEKPGELLIPEQTFTARELGQGRLFLNGGKLLRRKSEPHSITIKPIPKNYTGDNWLPAEDINIQESWSSDPEQLRAGDSITRSITVTAQDLTAAQLPPINFERIKGIKLYPDKPETNNQESTTGLTATRTDSTAIIATQPGTITLPSITVHWWDTKENKAKRAEIPARTINVLASLDDHANQSNAIDHSTKPLTTDESSKEIITVVNPFWMICSFILLLLWLITAFAYWRLKNRNLPDSKNTTGASDINLSEKKAFEQLKEACRRKNAGDIRAALINWAKAKWPNQKPQTLTDIIHLCDNSQLTSLLQQFDNQQYGKTTDSSTWNHETLINLIQTVRKQKPENTESKTSLPELYRV